MPSTKKRARETSSAEMYAAVDALGCQDLSAGAVEALRLAHIQFLSRITAQLAQLGKDDEQQTIQPKHVDDCVKKMGFSDYVTILGNATTERDGKMPSKTKRKKKQKQTWSAEMEAEQEKLLAQSRQTVQSQQEQQKQA